MPIVIDMTTLPHAAYLALLITALAVLLFFLLAASASFTPAPPARSFAFAAALSRPAADTLARLASAEAERDAAIAELASLRAVTAAVATPPPPLPCVRGGLAFVVAGFLRAPSPVLALHLSSIASLYGARARVFLVNNGDAASLALLAAALAATNVTGVIVENSDVAEYGYEWGALRAAARWSNWTAACVPFEHIIVTQANAALFATLPEPLGDFKRVMWFEESWDNIFMRDWVMHSLGQMDAPLEARAGGVGDGPPVSPICLPTFGPNWVLSGSCLEAWLRARALDIVRVNSKAKQCATERLTATVAAALCGAPCWDAVNGSFDGDISRYPDRFRATRADPGNLGGRHFLKSWGTAAEKTNPCNKDRPYIGGISWA